jgi:hypothetical protein
LNDFIKTELESAKDFESANEEKYNLEQILKKIMAAIRTAKHK